MITQMRIKLHKIISGLFAKKQDALYNPYKYPDGRVFDPSKFKRNKEEVKKEPDKPPGKTFVRLMAEVVHDDIMWLYSKTRYGIMSAHRKARNEEQYQQFVELAYGRKRQ